MTTEPTPLQERLWDAIFEARDLPDKTGQAPTETIVAAVLPIIAAEVRKAQADALRDAADDPALRLSGHSGISITRLRARAADIEKED